MQDISRRRDRAFQGMTTMRDYGKMTPLQAAGCVRERRRDLKESRRLTDTPGAIVATARKLFELRGVRATSIAAIAKERYKAALPLCSLGSLVLAVTFAVSSMFM